MLVHYYLHYHLHLHFEQHFDNYTIDNLLTVLKENGQALLVVNKTEREEVAREYIYDTIVKFLIALPFASTLDLNEALHHIQLDFRRMNMLYLVI